MEMVFFETTNVPDETTMEVKVEGISIHTHTHTHARTHARTHAHTRTHTHMHTHACIHTHTPVLRSLLLKSNHTTYYILLFIYVIRYSYIILCNMKCNL